jgi:hypothetical protein
VATLKASRFGLIQIQQARRERGWGWNGEDDACFVAASYLLEPGRAWDSGGPYAYGISLGTWKRFLSGKAAINAHAFKAYCQVLGLDWEDVVDRHNDYGGGGSQQDWDETIDGSQFYGRTEELAELEHWAGGDRCRLIVLSGMGGIGKTSLSVQFAKRLESQFEFVVRRSLRRAPPLQELLHECNTFLGQPPATSPDVPLDHFLNTLRQYRCLVIFDDVETILCSGKLAGQYQVNYQPYRELFRRIGQESHQSCVVVITREKLRDLTSLTGQNLPVRDFQLGGLDLNAAKQVLAIKGFDINARGTHDFIQLYRGHPLALKLMANTIREIFGGQLDEFLSQSTLVLGDIMPGIFYQQLQRLSDSESIIINWIALANRPLNLRQLRQYLQFSALSTSQIVTALESLKRRSLLEVMPSDVGSLCFSLEPVLIKYIIGQLTEKLCHDIEQLTTHHTLSDQNALKMYCLVENPQKPSETARPWIVNKLKNQLLFSTVVPEDFNEQLETMQSQLQLKSAKEIGYCLTNLSCLSSMG